VYPAAPTHGGHGTSAEKVLAHPAIVVFKLVRGVLVDKDVDEDLALWLQPGSHFSKEVRVSLHVLEHFDREDVSESAEKGRMSIIWVRRGW